MKAIAGIVVLLGLAWVWSSLSPESSHVMQAAPVQAVEHGSVSVVSLECGHNSQYFSAKITISNTGQTEINTPNVFVEFTPRDGQPFMDSVRVSPRRLPAGSLAEGTIISRQADRAEYQCAVARIQDGSGARID